MQGAADALSGVLFKGKAAYTGDVERSRESFREDTVVDGDYLSDCSRNLMG